MRRVLSLMFTSMVALAVFLAGNPAAHAFGSEVLGCAFNSAAWTANSCEGGGDATVNDTVHFSAHSLSGTYTAAWTVTNEAGTVLSSCSSTVTYNCKSGGCTSSSTSCDVIVHSNLKRANRYTASLLLTQSGQTRTITASALVYQDGTICLTC